ncbi:MAG: MFS transporter [Candidatus Dormibacteria bacterium]
MVNSGSWSNVVAPLRERDFRLLWAGNLASLLGDGIFTVALALEALAVDRQPTGLAYVLACRTVPSIAFGIVGGVVVDRISRRTAMLMADLARGLAVAVIGILVFEHVIALWHLVVMAVVFGIADSFGEPAFLAVVPEIVPARLITQANALSTTSGQLASNLVGPALGGLAVGVIGRAGAFGLDTASFGVLLVCLLFLKVRSNAQPSGRSFFAEAGDGVRYIASRRWLYLLLLGAAFANLVGMGPYLVLLPVMVRHVLHGSAMVLGLIYAASGASGVVAALVVGRLGTPRYLVEIMWSAYCLGGLAVAGIAFAPDAIVTGALSALSAGLIVYGDVLYFTRLQTAVPQRLLGRVSSVSFVMVMTLTPVGTVLGGVMAATLGARGGFLLSGLLAATAGVVLLIPGARDVEPLPGDAEPGAGASAERLEESGA